MRSLCSLTLCRRWLNVRLLIEAGLAPCVLPVRFRPADPFRQIDKALACWRFIIDHENADPFKPSSADNLVVLSEAFYDEIDQHRIPVERPGSRSSSERP